MAESLEEKYRAKSSRMLGYRITYALKPRMARAQILRNGVVQEWNPLVL